MGSDDPRTLVYLHLRREPAECTGYMFTGIPTETIVLNNGKRLFFENTPGPDPEIWRLTRLTVKRETVRLGYRTYNAVHKTGIVE